MTDPLPLLYGFGELVVILVLLSILRTSAKPRPQPQDEWGSHDEPFECDPDYSDEDEPKSRMAKPLKFY